MKSKFLLRMDDGGFPDSLESCKFNRVAEDDSAAIEGMARVIDESRQDCLNPLSCFVEVLLSVATTGRLEAA